MKIKKPKRVVLWSKDGLRIVLNRKTEKIRITIRNEETQRKYEDYAASQGMTLDIFFQDLLDKMGTRFLQKVRDQNLISDELAQELGIQLPESDAA